MNTTTTFRAATVAGLVTVSTLLASGVAGAAPVDAPTQEQPVTRAASQAQRDSVYRLYKAYFLRNPDQSGHGYWSEQYSSGRQSLAAISQYFSQSPEFKNRYGSLTNAQFTGLIYKNVLNRTPDDAGESYWVQRLNQGVSRGSVMIGFSESAEFQRKTNTRAPAPPVAAVTWQAELLNLTNAERTSRGLRAMTLCGPITNAAQGHSNFQAQKNVMTHTGVNGSSVGTRLSWAGYRWTFAGENVAMGASSYKVADIVKAWMASPSHRANILNPNYVHMGVARTASSNGTLHWTQNFGAGGSC